jgi:hypothetical protein
MTDFDAVTLRARLGLALVQWGGGLLSNGQFVEFVVCLLVLVGRLERSQLREEVRS